MGATIHVNEDIKTRLKLLARSNETEDEVLQRLIRYTPLLRSPIRYGPFIDI